MLDPEINVALCVDHASIIKKKKSLLHNSVV